MPPLWKKSKNENENYYVKMNAENNFFDVPLFS